MKIKYYYLLNFYNVFDTTKYALKGSILLFPNVLYTENQIDFWVKTFKVV